MRLVPVREEDVVDMQVETGGYVLLTLRIAPLPEVPGGVDLGRHGRWAVVELVSAGDGDLLTLRTRHLSSS